MQAYSGFARTYDRFMDEMPYDDWAENITKLLQERGIHHGIIADLGCGTGAMTRRLAAHGYDMIGIDLSEEMLEVARIKSDESILYLHQDMREFELFGTVSAIVSVCDSLNYILEEDELFQVFRLVNNYLEKDGIFIFDLNTEHYYKDVLGSNVFAQNLDDCSYIWENYYDEDEKINEYDITIYEKEENSDHYVRLEETHVERAFEAEIIEELLQKAGMKLLGRIDTETGKQPGPDCTRMYFIAQEGFQGGKRYE